MVNTHVLLVLVLGCALILTGCGMCSPDGHLARTLPPASPLRGYREQPGISPYDSMYMEMYLGEYY